MIPGYYNFICNKKNKNCSNELEKIEIEEIEPNDYFFQIFSEFRKAKTKDINIINKYNLEFDNLYDINAENTIKGLSIKSNTIENEIINYNNKIIKKIFLLDNNNKSGFFIIYNDNTSILVIYGENIKYINFMSGYIYNNDNIRKVDQTCTMGCSIS
jgi:hypothetical protein